VDSCNPFLGATSDGIAQCDCFEKRAVKVKCPFCFKDEVPETTEPGFCMRRGDDDVWKLDLDHMYYYQVQL